MDLKEYRKVIDLAELLDQKQRELIVMRRWVEYKRTMRLDDSKLLHLSKKENPVYKTHQIQTRGKYPDIIYEFSKNELQVYKKRLEALRRSYKRDEYDLKLQINKNTDVNR
jgi:hypothetical protein